MLGNMKATLLFRERNELDDHRFFSIVIWQLPQPLPASPHSYKYRLALVVRDVCVLRYDNEAGKGDHKHVGERECGYSFTTLDQLLADFRADVLNWRDRDEKPQCRGVHNGRSHAARQDRIQGPAARRMAHLRHV
jgi:hypothetical protein